MQAWDGKDAWQISPFQGRKDPEKMSADDAKALADDAPIAGALIGAKERGDKIEYLGTEDVDGTDAHKLKVTRKNGDVEYVYLDPDHFLEIRIVTQRNVRGTLSERINRLRRLRGSQRRLLPVLDRRARARPTAAAQQTTIERAEANVAASTTALFAFPAGKAGTEPEMMP